MLTKCRAESLPSGLPIWKSIFCFPIPRETFFARALDFRCRNEHTVERGGLLHIAAKAFRRHNPPEIRIFLAAIALELRARQRTVQERS
jgi:hypothetical protein